MLVKFPASELLELELLEEEEDEYPSSNSS